MEDLSERMRDDGRRRRVRNRWIGFGAAVVLMVAGLLYYQVPQRLLDAAGMRCGAEAAWDAAEALEFSDVFQAWDQAETSGEHEFEDGSIFEWDYAEEVAELEQLGEIISAEPILLHLQPVHDEPQLIAATADTFVINNPSGHFDGQDQTVRVDFAEREIQWAYGDDVPRLALPGPRALADTWYVGLHQRSVPGDQARLELRSHDLHTGEVTECLEVLGPVDADAIAGRRPAVIGEVTAVGEDQFLVHLIDRSRENPTMDTTRWLGLFSASDGELVWQTETDSAMPGLDSESAIAATESGAVVLSWLPAPRYISAPLGRLDGTGDYSMGLGISGMLHAEQEGEQVQAAMPGRVVPSEAYDLSDGSPLWEYGGADELVMSLPAVPDLGGEAPGAAVMLRAEMMPADQVHDPQCADGRGGCPVAWSMEMVDDSGAALWTTALPVGESPGAWARWGDALVHQEDEDWSDEYPDNDRWGQLTGYDVNTGEQLWTLESQAPAHIDQAVETHDGWMLFDHPSPSSSENVRIIHAQTGEVVSSGGGVGVIRGLQADEDYIVVQFGDGHTAILERR